MNSVSQNIFLDRNRGTDRSPVTHVRRFGRSPHRMFSMSTSASGSRPMSSEANLRASQMTQSHASGTQLGSPRSAGVHTASSNRRDRCLLALAVQKVTDQQGQRGSLTSAEFKGSDAAAFRHGNDDVEPLEEKLCLEDLQSLMNFFSSSFTRSLQRPQSSSKSIVSKVALSNTLEKQRSRVSRISILSPCVSCAPKCDGTPNKDNPSVENTFPNQEVARNKNEPSSFSIYSRDGTIYSIDTKEKLQQVLTDNNLSASSHPNEDYTRVLSEKEFADAVKFVLPSATDAEIMELMKKVDYEAKGTTTWDDFSTFLLSQGRHRSNMANGISVELITSPEPSDTVLSHQHVTGTCMDSDAVRKILLSGGAEGTVRAWNLEKLESDGVVFAGDDWVVGVHWANPIQSIIVVTMSRKVIIIDSKTFGVNRLYRGRAVIDSAEGHMYSHESIPLVRIGGKIKPETRRRERNGAGAIMRAKLKNTDPLSQSPSLPSQGSKQLALLHTGPYVECTLEECTLAGLVDAVSCSLFQRSVLGEDIVLLGTTTGEVRFYALRKVLSRVITPHAVIRPHERRINKMAIMLETNALFTASDDGTVKMTSLDNGALLRTFFTSGSEQHSAVHDFAINPQLRLLVTVGPERYGIVWDFSHDAPMAILDAHNSPCRCCTMYVIQSQILTCAADGSIFVFDAHCFRLVQILHTHLHPQCMSYDETRQRLVCLASRPYFHGQKRCAPSAFLRKYNGHLATMVGVMYNASYDLIVTIDAEGLVMTWRRSSGADVFTFQLKDFSGSAVTNAARLTCFALDRLERRLLTGFNDGTVAVWNLVNGQTTNVITASTESFTITPRNPGVTALGSLTRDGLTFFLFAAAGHLFTTRESSTFTITSATKWPLPEDYGEIIAFLPVSPQIVACGTSSGALIFYHILSGRQEGSALWVIDNSSDLSPHQTTPHPHQHHQHQHQHQVRRSVASLNTGNPPMLPTSRCSSDGRCEQQAVLTSRVMQVFPLHGAGAHVLMAVHSDGTIALWHTVRRLLMDTVSVRSVLPSNTEGGLSHVAMDRNHQHFVFSDDAGNVHVCRIELRSVFDEGSLCPPRLPQIRCRGERPIVQWPGSPFDAAEFAKMNSATSSSTKEEAGAEQFVGDSSKDIEARIDPERVPFAFSVFCREYVFHTGMPSVSGLCIIDGIDGADAHNNTALSDPAESITLPVTGDLSISPDAVESSRPKEGERPHSSVNSPHTNRPHTSIMTSPTSPWTSAPPIPGSAVIIVSSGGDNFTRLFTLDGTIVGECGMNTWTLGQPSTYEHLGKKMKLRLPPHYCGYDPVDFLQDAAVEKTLSVIQRRPRPSRVAIIDGVGVGAGISLIAPSLGELSSVRCLGTNGMLCGASGTALGEQSAPLVAAAESLRVSPQAFYTKMIEEDRTHLTSSKMNGVFPSPNAEATVLSTQMRARRRSRDVLSGIVKREFIPHLRGFPLMSGDDDSTQMEAFMSSDLSLMGHSGAKLITGFSGHVDAPSETSLPSSMLTTSHAGSVNITSTQNNVVINSGSGDFMASVRTLVQPPVLVRGDGKGRLNKSQRHAKQLSLLSSERNLPVGPLTRPPTASAVQSRGDAPLEDDVSSRALVSERLEAQRRMLRKLGRTDSVLSGTLGFHHSIRSSRVSADGESKSTSNFCNQLLAARQLKAAGTAKESKVTVAQITSRLRTFHVEEMLPPKGTHAHDNMMMWAERIKKIGK